jgi:molybdenum storage protein
VFVKDEDGLYDKDPKRHADATKFGTITLAELMTRLPDENILDRELFHAWQTAKNLKRIVIVNGLRRGELTRALRGEDVGTVIVKEAA